jgi:hypothetical protein
MENIFLKFINAKAEFIGSKASEKSVENLYDVLYLLVDIKERNFDEEYTLAKTYDLVGENIYASKIVEKLLTNNSNDVEIKKLKTLEQKIKNQNIWSRKLYRDLRDARIIKQPTKLNLEDFIISKDRDEYCIEISDKFENIVILNKNVKNEGLRGNSNNYIAFANKEPTDYLLNRLMDYIEWLGQVKNELLDFYNNSFFDEGKIYNVGQKWFDGLEVFDFWISIDVNDDFEGHLILHDYLQDDYGFRLEMENKTIKSIEYDAIL